MGQWASTRTDLFSLQVCQTLARLQSNIKPHSFQRTERIFSDSYGPFWRNVIEILDEKPIGVGAIAQVYRGRLIKDDQEVAIKVLHPGVEKTILTDLIIMESIAKIISYIPGVEWLSLVEEVQAFAGMMRLQMDLRIEAQNLNHFHKRFKDSKTIKFPKIFDEYTQKDILVEEFIFGVSIDKFLQLAPTVMDSELAANGLNGFLVGFWQLNEIENAHIG
jgi:aarF domain-containing kinase